MKQLFLKATIRALVIFFPVAALSFIKDTLSAQKNSGQIHVAEIFIILLLGITMIGVWVIKKRNNPDNRNAKS